MLGEGLIFSDLDMQYLVVVLPTIFLVVLPTYFFEWNLLQSS